MSPREELLREDAGRHETDDRRLREEAAIKEKES